METNVFKRDDESAKAIRNEVELIILLYGHVIDYEYILNHFEISQKTFKRDMEGIRKALETIFDDARLIKLKDKLAYKLYIPHKPMLLF